MSEIGPKYDVLIDRESSAYEYLSMKIKREQAEREEEEERIRQIKEEKERAKKKGAAGSGGKGTDKTAA